MKRVIYSVEDDKDISSIIRLALVSAGYEVYSFLDGESFLDAFNNKKPDLVLLDMMLPKISGEEILKYIRSNKLKIIICTGEMKIIQNLPFSYNIHDILKKFLF